MIEDGGLETVQAFQHQGVILLAMKSLTSLFLEDVLKSSFAERQCPANAMQLDYVSNLMPTKQTIVELLLLQPF